MLKYLQGKFNINLMMEVDASRYQDYTPQGIFIEKKDRKKIPSAQQVQIQQLEKAYTALDFKTGVEIRFTDKKSGIVRAEIVCRGVIDSTLMYRLHTPQMAQFAAQAAQATGGSSSSTGGGSSTGGSAAQAAQAAQASAQRKAQAAQEARKRVAAQKEGAKQSTSKSARAGLQFPVSRVGRFLRNGRYAERVAAGAPVYMAQC